MLKIDNGFNTDGRPFRRFYLKRTVDQTGISRTGRVLEGAVTQSGKVFVEWRPPHSTMGIYNSYEEFRIIHVDCHPSCNEVVWLDSAYQNHDGTWHCFSCGCGSNVMNFCAQCGAGKDDFAGPGVPKNPIKFTGEEVEAIRKQRDRLCDEIKELRAQLDPAVHPLPIG